MYSRVETITPEIAQEYLKRNVKNRPIKKAAISNYARDMKAGNWQLTPQGISFYENGNLADGQNRLLAIIRAGVPVDVYVTYGVPDDSTIQDRGVLRSSSDVLKMDGISSAAGSTNGVSIVNFLFSLAGRNSISDQVRKQFILENEDFLVAAVSLSSRAGGGSAICRKASVMGALFCAMYCGIDQNDLVRFSEVANTGFSSTPSETAAIVLRNALIQDYTALTSSNRKELFVIATNAIRDFANGTPRTKKYRTSIKPVFWDFVKKSAIAKYIETYSDK